jgi:hypothetical protein
MQVVALAGRNAQTESWLRSVLAAAALSDARVLKYRHWTSDAEADVGFEASLLANLSPDLVVAKSFGTAVAATAYRSATFRPKAAVFIGTPFLAAGEEGLSDLIEFAQNIETLFIQQSEDPGGSASALTSALSLMRGTVKAVPGSDHLYQDVGLVASLIRSWDPASDARRGAAA